MSARAIEVAKLVRRYRRGELAENLVDAAAADNHSDRFWAVVASVLPDYKARQAKLKELQARLAGEDWD